MRAATQALHDILDAQLHAADLDVVEQHVAMMDAAGVAAALLVQTIPQGTDNSLLLESAARHPGRFGVVGVLDPADDDVGAAVTRWSLTTYAHGLRVVALSDERLGWLRQGRYDRLLAAAEREAVPVFVYVPRHIGLVDAIARRFPSLSVIVDHLGLPQPPVLEGAESPWRDLPQVLELARYPNVALKVTAMPTVSTEPFPFADLRPRLEQVVDAFGCERLMWGSDITRHGMRQTYEESVAYLRDCEWLSESEKDQLLGKAIRAILGWSPSGAAAPLEAQQA